MDGHDVQIPLLQGRSLLLTQAWAGPAYPPRPTPQQCLHLPLLWKCEGCYLWRAGWVSLAYISARKEGFLEEEDKQRKMAGGWRGGGCSRPGREHGWEKGTKGFSLGLSQ